MFYLQVFVCLSFFLAVAFCDCGGTLNATTGYQNLSSPNYPKPIRSDFKCKWTIIASNGSTVSLKVSDLDIDTREETTCNKDYLLFINQGDKTPRIYCGKEKVPVFVSSGNEVVVEFSSHGSNDTDRKGFLLEYASVEITTPAAPTTTTTTTTTPLATNSSAPPTTATDSTSASSTVPNVSTTRRPVPTEAPSKKLPSWAIALIVILVLLLVLLVIDVVLYRKNTGLIYTIKTRCCGGYEGM